MKKIEGLCIFRIITIAFLSWLCLSIPFQCKAEHKDKFHVKVHKVAKHPDNHSQKDELNQVTTILKKRLESSGANDIIIAWDHSGENLDIDLMIEPKDTESVKKMITTQGNLGIYETYNLGEIFPFILDADKKLYNYNLKSGNDTNSRPFVLALNYKKDNESAMTPIIGHVKIHDTSNVNKILSLPFIVNDFPEQLIFSWSDKPGQNTDIMTLYSLKGGDLSPYGPILSGVEIEDAWPDIDKFTGAYAIDFRFKNEVKDSWKNTTRENIGKRICIVLDNKVICDLKILNEITNGNCRIWEDFTIDEAKNLATILKCGPLPFPLKVVKFNKVN
jgi:preprotein translocase subunit SecD